MEFNHVKDDLADGAFARRHAEKLRILVTQDELRKEEAEKRRIQAEDKEDPSEKADAFYGSFRQHLEEIRADMVSENRDVPVETALLGFSERIRVLEEAVAGAVYYLPQRNLKGVQSELTEVKEELAAKKAKLLPRVKFSFSRNKERKVKLEDSGKNSYIKEEVVKNGKGERTEKEKVNLLVSKKQENGEEEDGRGNEVMEKEENDKCFSKIGETSDGGSVKEEKNGFRNKVRQETMSSVDLRDKKNETFFFSEVEVRGCELSLQNLQNCCVYVHGTLSATYIFKLINCRIFMGPVEGAAHIEGVENSCLVIAAHQIRIHSSKSTDFYLRVRSQPIVEKTTAVRFAPYSFRYDEIEKDLKDAKLDEENELWQKVNDFKWLRATQSPNWSILPLMERLELVDGTSEMVNGGKSPKIP